MWEQVLRLWICLGLCGLGYVFVISRIFWATWPGVVPSAILMPCIAATSLARVDRRGMAPKMEASGFASRSLTKSSRTGSTPTSSSLVAMSITIFRCSFWATIENCPTAPSIFPGMSTWNPSFWRTLAMAGMPIWERISSMVFSFM